MSYVKIHRDLETSNYAYSSKNITKAFKQAVKEELKKKKELKIPIAIYKNGKVIKIPPEKI